MISISILGLMNQLERLDEVNSIDVDSVHLDVMDGIFVSDCVFFDDDIVSKIRKPLNVHLMVQEPGNYIAFYSKYSPKYITVHMEVPNAIVYLDAIRNKKIGAGLAINPNTDLKKLEAYLPYVDMVLVMSVEPGKGGQEFKSSSLRRIEKIKNMCNEFNPSIVIAVDGGVGGKNIKACKSAGADMFVVGSYITSSNFFQEVVLELKDKLNKDN